MEIQYVHLLRSPPPPFPGANRELPAPSSVRWCPPSRLYSGPTARIARRISCHDPRPRLRRSRRWKLHGKFWRRTAARLLPCESETRLSAVNVPFERPTVRYVPPYLQGFCAVLRCRTCMRCLTAASPRMMALYRTALGLWLFPCQLGRRIIST